jgi:hypothetical protein
MNSQMLRTTICTREVLNQSVSVSISSTARRDIALVVICGAGGIGTILETTETSVNCLLGCKTDGYEEAFARSLLQKLNLSRMILTLSLLNRTREVFKSLLDTICLDSIM